ncbi:50S ribosomal protein L11 methyltransferase [Ponticaulis sp.]|uniref:50S ribosomal protein L11 methyltransferase n=1 Tax=Ponticaulis sp. TaxID=2020902 RepID=UPI000B657BDD|nr:50S ribosomal protein L11 methyltransferase [Ponticaulis sp.]MAI89041.1 50S ribosomal protein L11 methyltransferase [Ponticaulis sp.]OUY01721.1 MAG: 50S ribosomal protein L11 methyltransferase [Hyphomonadaceae bacterium TMED5]|tara:strand:- start:56521 stop:57495 length:975 start_codon:yes stop_codon:yes gene_type:complete
MFMVSATAPRDIIQAAADALTFLDPSPAAAVDTKEESRTLWRIDAYTMDFDSAHGCAGIIELVDSSLNPVVTELEDKDWVAVSLEGLPAVEAGPFIVAGAHELAKGHPGKIPLWIEAGPAFGTGHHGTTAGCLLALENHARKRKLGKVFDVGTGSGVLAIGAIKRGATFAIASDLDAESVRVAKVNADNNNVANKIKVLQAVGARNRLIQTNAPYDTIFANILAKPLIGLSGDLARLLKPGGVVILSGLLTFQEPSVRGAFSGRGLKLVDRIRRDGWSTLVYQKPKAKPEPVKIDVKDDVAALIKALESGDMNALKAFDGFEDA